MALLTKALQAIFETLNRVAGNLRACCCCLLALQDFLPAGFLGAVGDLFWRGLLFVFHEPPRIRLSNARCCANRSAEFALKVMAGNLRVSEALSFFSCIAIELRGRIPYSDA